MSAVPAPAPAANPYDAKLGGGRQLLFSNTPRDTRGEFASKFILPTGTRTEPVNPGSAANATLNDAIMARSYTNKTSQMNDNDIHWEIIQFVRDTAAYHNTLDTNPVRLTAAHITDIKANANNRATYQKYATFTDAAGTPVQVDNLTAGNLMKINKDVFAKSLPNYSPAQGMGDVWETLTMKLANPSARVFEEQYRASKGSLSRATRFSVDPVNYMRELMRRSREAAATDVQGLLAVPTEVAVKCNEVDDPSLPLNTVMRNRAGHLYSKDANGNELLWKDNIPAPNADVGYKQDRSGTTQEEWLTQCVFNGKVRDPGFQKCIDALQNGDFSANMKSLLEKMHPQVAYDTLRYLGFRLVDVPSPVVPGENVKNVQSFCEWKRNVLSKADDKLKNAVNGSNSIQIYLTTLVAYLNANPAILNPNMTGQAGFTQRRVVSQLADDVRRAMTDYTKALGIEPERSFMSEQAVEQLMQQETMRRQSLARMQEQQRRMGGYGMGQGRMGMSGMPGMGQGFPPYGRMNMPMAYPYGAPGMGMPATMAYPALQQKGGGNGFFAPPSQGQSGGNYGYPMRMKAPYPNKQPYGTMGGQSQTLRMMEFNQRYGVNLLNDIYTRARSRLESRGKKLSQNTQQKIESAMDQALQYMQKVYTSIAYIECVNDLLDAFPGDPEIQAELGEQDLVRLYQKCARSVQKYQTQETNVYSILQSLQKAVNDVTGKLKTEDPSRGALPVQMPGMGSI